MSLFRKKVLATKNIEYRNHFFQDGHEAPLLSMILPECRGATCDKMMSLGINDPSRLLFQKKMVATKKNQEGDHVQDGDHIQDATKWTMSSLEPTQ